MRRGHVALAAVVVPWLATAQVAQGPGGGGGGPFAPLLVAYSTGAPTAEGDPDYRQIVYVALPAGGPARHLWVYDADTAGRHDSAFAPGQESLTRMSVFAGPDAFRGPLEPEAEPALLRMGARLASRVFGPEPALDGQWVRLARLDPAFGAPFGEERVFRFQAEGLEGVEGNVFDLRLGTADGPDLGPSLHGARLFAYDLSLRAATPETVLEAPLDLPADGAALEIRNFDSGGGVLDLVGPFRTRRLAASTNDAWAVDRIALDPDEPGATGAISFFGGRETPNDLSLTARVETTFGRTRRLALALPRTLAARNARPKAEALATPVGCRSVRLDARLSEDEESAALAYRWRLPGGRVRTTPVALVRLDAAGEHPVRLEVDDLSGRSNARAALGFTVTLRDPPRAHIAVAPAIVAPGETVRLSGLGSTLGPDAAEGAVIESHVWQVGEDRLDGAEVAVAFEAPGPHEVRLTVTESGDHPCRIGEATAQVRVNAPPVAMAGPDRTVVAGAPLVFDAGASHDRDGHIRHHQWSFGDGRDVTGARATVAFPEPGRREVRLTVVDDSAVANSAARDVAVVDVRRAPNLAPMAEILGPDAVALGLPVAFSAAGSADPDGRLLAFRWRFDDGSTAEGPASWRSFFAPGPAVLGLEVEDASAAAGGRAGARHRLDVTVPPNRPPVADPGPDRRVATGERVIFDASGSRDADGRLLAFRWVFEPGVEAAGPVAVHAFQRPGRYAVRLEVEDDHPTEPARDIGVAIVTVRPKEAAP